MQDTNPGFSTRRKWDREQTTSAEVLRELLDSLPPHSREAEMSLLGSLILDPKAVAEVLGVLHGPDLFYTEDHANIYKAILALYDQHEGWDAVQLLEYLRDQGQLDSIGGVDYLKQLAECVPSAVNAPHYAKLIASKHRLRALIDTSWRIIYDAHNVGQLGPDGVATLLDRAEAEIFEISHDKSMRDIAALADILQEEIERLEALEGKGLTGVPTGYPDLDHMLSGLQPGEMLILAARPSMGKTAFALNIAEQV
ncbi:Replicative DNA helicase (DnaB), partial [hydrothermal vent metagenome]